MTSERDEAERVRGLLRQVRCPGFQRDIVASGFIKGIEVAGDRVAIRFAPNTRHPQKVEAMEADMRAILAKAGPFAQIDIHREKPFADVPSLSGGGATPRPAAESEHDAPPLANADAERGLRRPDIAREAGYDEEGPEPLGGPRSDRYEGALPVLQWEIDPHDPDAKSGTANLEIDDWEFRVWWQVHRAQLVYASIQALRNDWVEHAGAARSHPVGRYEAVNLVYDQQRRAVVAIYGTVSDFRPYVDAFYRGYVLKN